MARNFPNFIDAYVSHVHDTFVPEKFHYWMALSIIGAAIERKAWLPWSHTLNYYPNLYIMLVAKPGIGKSSAIRPGVDLLRGLAEYGQEVNILPEQMTEAKFISLMSTTQSYEVGSKIHYQSAGYFTASEASNSLKNVYGDFISCLTDFYDCPNKWVRATMKHGDENSTITNGCMNVIAGCTFDYLSKLITTENINGGFASRFIYVIQSEAVQRQSPWQMGATTDQEEMRKNLVQDLAEIGKLHGKFHADDEFKSLWTEWFPRYDQYRQSLESEAMQSLLTRKSTNLLKLCMIFSAAESSELLLTGDHWRRSMELLDSMEEDLPNMVKEANAQKVDTQLGLNAALDIVITKNPGMNMSELVGKLAHQMNCKPAEALSTINTYMNAKILVADRKGHIKFSSNAKEETPRSL